MMPQKTIIHVVGATAVGKTALAICLAQHFGTHIISADSRQIYAQMRIGTAVPSAQELAQVPHHFIQTHSIFEPLNAGSFEALALQTINHLHQKNDVIIVCGGSGLYVNAIAFGLDAMPHAPPEYRQKVQEIYENNGILGLQNLLRELDPVYYAQVDLQNHARIMRALEHCLAFDAPFSSVRTHTPKTRNFNQIWIGLNLPRPQLYAQINQRVDIMIHEGLIDEVADLLEYKQLSALNTVGYTEFFDFFDKKITQNQATELVKQHTRNFAKRQLTWFNKNKAIQWFEPKNYDEILKYIDEKLGWSN